VPVVEDSDVDTTTDFLDIPMDGLKDINELDDYLSQAIEKVTDPIKWWWDHRKVFPKLSAMAFDFLSVPGMFLICLGVDISIDLLTFQLIIIISNVNFCRTSLFTGPTSPFFHQESHVTIHNPCMSLFW
jgi:hypothetical protein